jgi:hypothetical protein
MTWPAMAQTRLAGFDQRIGRFLGKRGMSIPVQLVLITLGHPNRLGWRCASSGSKVFPAKLRAFNRGESVTNDTTGCIDAN